MCKSSNCFQSKCPLPLSAACVKYVDVALNYLGILSGDNLQVILAKINIVVGSLVTNVRAKTYAYGELAIFKTAGNSNLAVLEVGDYVQGFVEGQFINANYLGGNKALLASYDI
jgi:hypothetical protein